TRVLDDSHPHPGEGAVQVHLTIARILPSQVFLLLLLLLLRKRSLASLPALNSDLPLPLDSPHLISIHATLFDVLHTSGADTFFSALLRHYRERARARTREGAAARCWIEFEQVKEICDLREALLDFSSSLISIHALGAEKRV
ncbi:hypothetical protein CPB84DRAFT_1796345, partial [Gymnopilus junonius]